MSFGFSVGDIIEISRLTTDLIRRVRTAGAEFREFEGDLELARNVFVSIEANWNTDSGRTTAAWLRQDYNATLQTTMTGIQNGLEDLRHRLDAHSQTSFSRFQLSYRLQDLRRRLDFHMGSLQLVMQNLSLMQGRNIEDAMRLIREGQEEQQREDERNHISRQRNPNEQDWNESLSSFEMRYVPRRRNAGRASEAEVSSTSTSRDYLIERWRQTVASTLPSHLSPPDSFSGEETTIHSPRVHSEGSQSTPSSYALSGETIPFPSTQLSFERWQSNESTAATTEVHEEAAQHQQSGGCSPHQVVPSVENTTTTQQHRPPFGGKYGIQLKWIYIVISLLLWATSMLLAGSAESGVNAPPSQPVSFFIFAWSGVMVIFLLFALRNCCGVSRAQFLWPPWAYFLRLGLSTAVVQIIAGAWALGFTQHSSYCHCNSESAIASAPECTDACQFDIIVGLVFVIGGILLLFFNVVLILVLRYKSSS